MKMNINIIMKKRMSVLWTIVFERSSEREDSKNILSFGTSICKLTDYSFLCIS